MTASVLIVAAGRGNRAGGSIPKQYQNLIDRPVLQVTLEAFASHPAVTEAVVVLHQDDAQLFDRVMTAPSNLHITRALGGATRDASVRAGLEALNPANDVVLIHDAARPMVSHNVIDGVLAALETHEAAAPALPVVDALWRGADGDVIAMADRTGLYRAQTPQGFRVPSIKAAHATHAGGAADDVEVALAHGLRVAITLGEEQNLKITHPEDFARAVEILERHTKEAAKSMDIRCGNGFDVHAFEPGDHVVLCGVSIPHNLSLKGHSDADVAMHAVTDAIYGALADGDIGQHFPPSDPQWKGAASDIFLKHAVECAQSRGYEITNIDCTIICEQPKIGPHSATMRSSLAAIMGLSADRISVKATTSERLGFTGRGEGIAALASVTLVSR